MERGEIFDGVSRVFEEHLSIPAVSEQTHIFRDLQLDSIQQLTLVVELENHFRICFGEGEENGIETVGDVVDLVSGRLVEP